MKNRLKDVVDSNGRLDVIVTELHEYWGTYMLMIFNTLNCTSSLGRNLSNSYDLIYFNRM